MNKNNKALFDRLNQAAPMLAAIGSELSFTKAAEQLNIQQSAVSHRVRSLEQMLDTTLFERTTRSLKLTEAGKIICQAATDSISIWPQAIKKLKHLEESERIKLSVSSSVAMKWLIPLLSAKDKDIPDISLQIEDQTVDFEDSQNDVALRFGRGPYPGLHSVRLVPCSLQAVASPLIANILSNEQTWEKDKVQLISDSTAEQENSDFNWANYFSHNTTSALMGCKQSYEFERSDLVLIAAANGLGVALGRTLLIEQDLKAGFLKPIGPALKMDASYWLVCKPSFAETKRHALLLQWLRKQISNTIE